MRQSMLEMITESLIHERLDHVLMSNLEYQATMDEVDDMTAKVKAFHLSEEEKNAIKGLVSAYLTQNACYSKFSYQQGFKDCAALIMEVMLIKQDV